jgi:carbon-monoxide dehydrogenase large subunit
VAWLALHVATPVRWLEDARERLSANANCREHHYRITGYANQDGRLLALDCVANVDAGAYSVYPISSALEAAQVASLLPGPYDFNLYRCRSAAVATNKCPILPYRGVARTGVCLAIEAVMDAIARQSGLEPYEVRLRNLVQPDQMPFTNVVKKPFDGGDYPQSLRRAVAAIGLPAIRERQRRGELDERLIGVGFSIFCEQGAMGTAVLSNWGRPCRGMSRRPSGSPPMPALKFASVPIRTGRGTKPHWRKSRMRSSELSLSGSRCFRVTPCTALSRLGPGARVRS